MIKSHIKHVNHRHNFTTSMEAIPNICCTVTTPNKRNMFKVIVQKSNVQNILLVSHLKYICKVCDRHSKRDILYIIYITLYTNTNLQ